MPRIREPRIGEESSGLPRIRDPGVRIT